MNKKMWLGWAALALAMASGTAFAQTPGPTVDVSVNASTGAVTVSPTTVVVAQADNAVTWTITVKGYRFATSGGVSMPASAGYSCSNQASNSQVVCTRTTRIVGSFAYTLNLVPVGSSVPVGSVPNIWAQND
jgi:hypothetical protein